MSLLQRKNTRGDGAAGPGAQRAVGERSAGTGGSGAAPATMPDPELVERAQRRRFSAEYKLDERLTTAGVRMTPRFVPGPDFYNPEGRLWWDITTSAQWPLHVTKYGGQWG